MDRVKQIASHLRNSPKGLHALQQKNSDDVVITLAIRSPLCKARKGGFKDARTDELMLEIYRQAIAHSHIDPGLVGDICVGTVLTPDAPYVARSAALAAGFPVTVPVQTINRFCSSGLMAVTTIANQIQCGQIEVGLAIGVESMSENPDNGGPKQSDLISANSDANDCCERMGWTSENVATDYNISREEQDEFAAQSFQKAAKAHKLGYFTAEIVPFTVFQKDSTGHRARVEVSEDDGIRPGTTKEILAKIRPAFPQWGMGTTTGGNASQVTDGAAAVLLMTRRKANELGLRILAKYVTTAVAGVPPRIMGIGPVYAIPLALKNSGLQIGDVDLFEINEAFASQCVYVLKALGLPREGKPGQLIIFCDPHRKDQVNVNGGAIAFGHPLDKGIRQIVTGLNELNRRQGKVLVTSMCIGTGMGAAGVFFRE